METVLKRHVAIAEVFMYTHSTMDDKEPIDDSAAVIEELFKEKMSNVMQYFGQKDRIPDDLLHEADKVFLKCAGGAKNGRVKGLGNLSLEYTSGSISHSMPNEVLSQQVSQLSEENSRFLEDLSAVRESLTEERQRAAEEREKFAATQSAMLAEIGRIAQLVQGFFHPDRARH